MSEDGHGAESPQGVLRDLGFAGVLRVRASTRVRLTLLPFQPAKTIDRLTGTLALKGEANNLGRPEEGRLIWLVQRPGADSPEEFAHPVPIVLIPKSTSGVLENIPFEVKERHKQRNGSGGSGGAAAGHEDKDLAWDIGKQGIYGHAAIGFRIEPSHPAVEKAVLPCPSSGLKLEIPIDLDILGGDGAVLSDPSSLRVGSAISIRVKSGEMFKDHQARLRIWESESEPRGTAAGVVAVNESWRFGDDPQTEGDPSSRTHTLGHQLGIGPDGLYYTVDSAEAATLRFRYMLTLLGPDGKEVPDAPPVRTGLIVDAPPPRLTEWKIERSDAEEKSSGGPSLFRTSGTIDNLASGFDLPLGVTLTTYKPRTDKKGNVIPELKPLLGPRDATPISDRPGSLQAGFVLSNEQADLFVQDPELRLFGALSFVTARNKSQPFRDLVRFEANMKDDGKDTGFAPYAPGVLAHASTAVGVCTDLISQEDVQSELESSAVPTKAPPPWWGDPWAELTPGDAFADLAPWEGVFGHMYRDNAREGNITCGIGNLLPNLAAAQVLEFWNMKEGRKARPDEIETAWKAVSAKPRAQPAPTYKLDPDIALPYGEMVKQLERRYAEFHGKARTKFSAFDSYPRSSRRGIVEMFYAMGEGTFNGFGEFIKAVERRDWGKAAQETLRKGQTERIAWRVSLFEYAKVIDDQSKTGPAATGAPSSGAGGSTGAP